MNPGRELDALIAEKVMGRENVRFGPANNVSVMMAYDDYVYGPNSFPVPHYSTSIANAWAVVEKVGKRFCLITQESHTLTKAWFQKDQNEGYPVSYGETPAHAICVAALRTLE